MRKSLSLILIFSLSLFLLIGCGKTDKPTTIVNNYFSDLKSKANSDVVNSVISSVFTNDDESVTQEAKDTLSEVLSKLEVETQKETIDSNTATVSVNIKGISLSSVMDSLLEEIQNSSELHNLSKDDLSRKISEILITKIKNAELQDRVGQLNLKKENNKWTLITNDDDFLNAVFGMTQSQIQTLKH
ncbi:DUF5105 domain-containing protein [Clostridium sp. SHJSY1]|uniref:DUF5105 domain-containing protein n=1 Tax=Clostridium sp. SHJSY1 TaxID=2942483 RepID=UPI002874E850|nr:DUF5105 domain-containing protein [Clostridium sp. SHJSY1]MDS0526282.1 DUF5105 domain-containing protein [Clostridium sp. SHJSY1]